MKYITLDTCVWLGLLEIDFSSEDNYFEEICFWINNKQLIHIVPENIIDEWNKNKNNCKDNAIRHLKENEQNLLNRFKNESTLSRLYNPDKISEVIQNRIDRIDFIFDTSEKAIINDNILIEAGKRNLRKQPPNHIKEGYKDTVNILTLINYLKLKKYNMCIFSTIDGDFGAAKNQPNSLHSTLINEFKEVNLEYIYFGNKKNIGDNRNVFGEIFFNKLRKNTDLPNFQDFLKEKKSKEDDKIVEERKINDKTKIDNPNSDYLENIKHIDIILAKKIQTSFDLEVIKSLIGRHDSYKQYFLNNIGNNGLD